MVEFMRHLLLPHESNNHRAKLLHHDSILFVIIFLLCGWVVLGSVKTHYPQVLSAVVDFSSDSLLQYTNQKRLEHGFGPLTLNEKLNNAAKLKANDMLEKNYWAHNAPDGTTPWSFIKETGYAYVYAGENLARGFTSSEEAVEAWMASETHRENMLSDRYSDIGFAIAKGKLDGEETILVVEMFGNTTADLAISQPSKSSEANVALSSAKSPQLFGQQTMVSFKNSPSINSSILFRNIGLAVLLLFVLVFVVDMVVVERRKIVRLVGHNIDHIVFLLAVGIIMFLVGRGAIL